MQTSFMIADPALQDSGFNEFATAIPPFQSRAGHENHARVNFFPRSDDHSPANRSKIEETLAYMSQHLNQPLQVGTLATMVNISPSHFFALFKRYIGCAPMDYFTRLRMEEARRLLDTTDSSVKEVAAALGYDDPFYFSRVFKSVNQLAPSNYRMKQREQSSLA